MNRQFIATWTLPVTVFTVATLVALVVRQILLRIADRRANTGYNFFSVLTAAVRGPSVLWCIAVGLAIAIHNADAPRSFNYWAQKAIGVFTIVSIGLVVAAVAVRMVAFYGERKSLRIAGLSQTLVNLVIFGIVLLMVLSQFNVQITPVLTALGVGGLAVALALQDTLANFFAGIHILIEEPIRVGNFVSLSKDEEGMVRDIGWRTTRLLTGANNIIVIPNQKITSGILTNYSLPEPRLSAEIIIMASHDADPDRIAALAMDAASETMGVLEDPAPSVWFDPGVLQTHLQMKLIVHVPGYLDRARVQSEIRTRIVKAFRDQGIPFPVIRV